MPPFEIARMLNDSGSRNREHNSVLEYKIILITEHGVAFGPRLNH